MLPFGVSWRLVFTENNMDIFRKLDGNLRAF